MAVPYRNILVIRISALGDVAMTIPVLYPICETYPEHTFTLLTSTTVLPLFANRPSNLNIVAIDTKNESKGIKGIFKVFKVIKSRNFDAVADLHGVLRSGIFSLLFALNGARVERIHKGRKEKRCLVSEKNKELKQLKSSFTRYADVIEKFGFKYPNNFSALDSPIGDEDLPKELLPNAEDKLTWIGIAPISKHKGKNYPLKKMQEVIRLLDSENRYKIFLFGAKNDIDILDQLAYGCSNTISLASMGLGFCKEMALMKKLALLVSMDSANMHIAAIMGTPVISIWGSTHPYAGFLGWGMTEDSVLQRDIPCRPCSVFGNKPCRYGTYDCLNIKPLDVIDKIKRELKKNDENYNK